METRKFSAVLMTLCLLVVAVAAQAQAKKGETITTAPKLVISKVKLGEGAAYEVRGKATFTLTAANTDDSIAGVITYTLPDDARAKIAQLAGKPVEQIPASIQHKDVVATFQKATSCPVVHLEFTPLDVNIAGVTTHFNRFVLDVEDGGTVLHRMVCLWARQINDGRSRRGIIARMNIIITGEDPEAQQQQSQNDQQ
jgi:hypothetical protein